MTVNYRRSVNGSNDQLGRKYLSDALSHYWGSWTNVNAIAYNNLPPTDCIARLSSNGLVGPGHISPVFSFNNTQNLQGKLFEFYLKCPTVVPTALWIYFYSLGSVKFAGGGGFAPVVTGVWSKTTINLDTFGSYLYPMGSRSNLLSGISYFLFDFNSAAQYDFEIAGVNFRRP
jgi:hypothetical protein